jgi:hypothetical protein
MVASDGFKPSVASWNPSPYENLLISKRIINDELTWTVVGADGHASFTAEKPKLLSKSPAPTVTPLKKLTKTNKGESKEEINILRKNFNKHNKLFMTFNLKDKDKPDKPKLRSPWHKHYLEDNNDSNYTTKLKNYIDTEYKNNNNINTNDTNVSKYNPQLNNLNYKHLVHSNSNDNKDYDKKLNNRP